MSSVPTVLSVGQVQVDATCLCGGAFSNAPADAPEPPNEVPYQDHLRYGLCYWKDLSHASVEPYRLPRCAQSEKYAVTCLHAYT